jgi:cytochrome c oxidase subunit 1
VSSLNKNKLKWNRDAFRWLLLSITSVAISGFFSIFLVFLRTPGLASFFSQDIFKTSLIIHVDLSITVWMLTIFCLLNATAFTGLRKSFSHYSLLIGSLGVSLIAISPFFGGDPVLNNYVPVLNNFVFILGLSLFLCAVLISSLFALVEFIYLVKSSRFSYIEITSATGSIIYIFALLSFYLSYKQIYEYDAVGDIGHYYESIFWGFGHVIQFLYIQLMLLSWTVLTNRVFNKSIISLGLFIRLSIANIAFSLLCLLFYIFYTVESGVYIEYFTLHMKYFGGVSSSVLALVILYNHFKSKLSNVDYRFYSFICSVFVFGIGGAIGYMIHGANVTVPAHYHGSIVGITIALMGLIYYIISGFGYRFKSIKLLSMQLIIYCIGQTLHIVALSLSGGYGALRKTAGVELSSIAKFYMGLMGVGGLIAILSGAIFVLNCYFAIKNGRTVYESKK